MLRLASSMPVYSYKGYNFLDIYAEGVYKQKKIVVGQERMGTARSHKRNFERYLFIIATKLAIFHCYYVTTFRALQTMSKLDTRICMYMY